MIYRYKKRKCAINLPISTPKYNIRHGWVGEYKYLKKISNLLFFFNCS